MARSRCGLAPAASCYPQLLLGVWLLVTLSSRTGASRLSRVEAGAESAPGAFPRRISATASRGIPALQLRRDSEEALGRGLTEISLWDETVPGHEWGSASFLPLKNQLVDFQGYRYGVSTHFQGFCFGVSTHFMGYCYGSPSYNKARCGEASRRLQAFQNAAEQASSGDKLALLTMAGAVLNGTYYVAIGLGTPPQQQQVTFDTGSSILWTSCDCINCPQSSDIVTLNPYRPEASSSSQEVPCNVPGVNLCSKLEAENNNAFGCSRQRCTFQVKYGDQSTATGPVLQDTITFPDSKGSGTIGGPVFFGCARNQSGLLINPHSALDGLLGMGNSGDSALSQLAVQKVLPLVFSYCLDSVDPSGSHAILGRGPAPKDLQTVPLLQNPSPNYDVSYYYIGLQQITVGGQLVMGSDQLASISSDTGEGGVITDSGTTLTNLPDVVYNSLVLQISSASTPFAQDDPSIDLPCTWTQSLDVSGYPDIVLEFGSKKWNVKPTSYLLYFGFDSLQGYKICLGIMNKQTGLPSAIIGEAWLTDTYIRTDVPKGTFSWTPMNCKTGKYFAQGQTAVPGGAYTAPEPPASDGPTGTGPITDTIMGWLKSAPRSCSRSHGVLLALLWILACCLLML